MTEPAETHVLVSKARDGDRSAFEELVERFRARLSAFVQARLELRIGAKLDTNDGRHARGHVPDFNLDLSHDSSGDVVGKGTAPRVGLTLDNTNGSVFTEQGKLDSVA